MFPFSAVTIIVLVDSPSGTTSASVPFTVAYLSSVVTSNDNNDAMSIELEGQWMDGNNFLNVVDDSPRVFEINKPKQCKIGQIYKLNITFNQGYMIQDGVVKSLEKCDKFTVNCIEKRDKAISKEQQDKLMLEQEIISNVYGGKNESIKPI